MRIPIIAIIGLPNVGKSTFFNKVLGLKKALIYPEAGTTRDRHFGLTSWNDLAFYLVDTAGLARPGSDLERNIQKQTAIAVAEADLILFMVDGKTSPGNQDFAAAKNLIRTKKPAVLAANKIDARNAKIESLASEYVKLGLGQPFMISSINGSGIGDLLDSIVEKLNSQFAIRNSKITDYGLRIAFVGKPNVGKSSLVNALLKQDRLIVHETAGTTRSAVDIPFEYEGQKFILIDTAGIKKKWKQDADVAAAAAFQSIRVISSTEVALFVLDAASDMTFQDQAIAEEILEQKKPAVIVLNKIDLLDQAQQDRLLDTLPDYLPQMWFVPVLFSSAKTSRGLDLLLKFAKKAFSSASREIDQTELDHFLDKMTEENMPGKMEDQRAPKFYNLKQIATTPPVFKLTVNFPAAIATAWKKWFEKQFRLKFGFEGSPIMIRYIRKA